MHQINFIPPFAFEIKFQKPLWVCLGMYDHIRLKLHNHFINLIDMKLHTQNQLYMSFCFWDLKVLRFGDTWPCPPNITSSVCSFNRDHYVAWIRPKKSTHQWTNFFAKSKKPYFGGIFGYYPQTEIFPQKSDSISTYP